MKAVIYSVRAVMARRILVSFRVRPDALRRLLPSPFTPKLINGWGVAGICLIRLEQMRPRFMPAALGLSSENAAHRIAVEWPDHEVIRSGVYIPRRDTNSILNLFVGGRLFPGVHHLARFRSVDDEVGLRVELRSNDGEAFVCVEGNPATALPASSVFSSLEEASRFMKTGSCGWSPALDGQVEAVELRTDNWEVKPLEVSRVESSYFADISRFPKGSVEFDSALLMRGIRHTWTAVEGRNGAKRAHHRHQAFFELP